MKIKSIYLIGLLIFLVSSCVVISFYPIYTEDTLILDNRIIGKWESKHDDSIWEICLPDTLKSGKYEEVNENQANKYTYLLKTYLSAEPDKWAEFWLHLVKIGNNIYADFYPVDWNIEMEFLMFHKLSVHSFAKVKIGEEIDFKWFDPDWLEKLFDQNKIHIRHEESNTGNILLTAKSEELQKFLLKYGDEPEPYEDGSSQNFKRMNQDQ